MKFEACGTFRFLASYPLVNDANKISRLQSCYTFKYGGLCCLLRNINSFETWDSLYFMMIA